MRETGQEKRAWVICWRWRGAKRGRRELVEISLVLSGGEERRVKDSAPLITGCRWWRHRSGFCGQSALGAAGSINSFIMANNPRLELWWPLPKLLACTSATRHPGSQVQHTNVMLHITVVKPVSNLMGILCSTTPSVNLRPLSKS
jgi:hypothetical protein